MLESKRYPLGERVYWKLVRGEPKPTPSAPGEPNLVLHDAQIPGVADREYYTRDAAVADREYLNNRHPGLRVRFYLVKVTVAQELELDRDA